MKKTTKALYAAAAGLALITSAGGGRATYASWIDTAHLSNATIETGDLRLDFVPLDQQIHKACIDETLIPAGEPNAGQKVNPNGQAPSAYYQVCWTLTPPVGQPQSSYHFSNLVIGRAYVLTGVTRVKATLQGATMLANLVQPVVQYGPDRVAGDFWYEDLMHWLNDIPPTDVRVYMYEGEGAEPVVFYQRTNGTSSDIPTAFNSTNEPRVFRVEVRVTFPSRELPPRSDVPQAAYFRLGHVDLELLQRTGNVAFTGS